MGVDRKEGKAVRAAQWVLVSAVSIVLFARFC
jgi:hypothetical protein